MSRRLRFLPVMVILDAFFLSHTYEPVDIPDQEAVDRFIPPMEPKIKLDTTDPHALGQMVPPGAYMEMRHDIQQAMERVPSLYRQLEEVYTELFGRAYGDVEAVQCDDADIVLVVSGTATGTCREALSDLRSRGEKAGMLKIKMFRPFPDESIRRSLRKAAKIAVVDRNCSFGAGGIFAQEIRSALCRMEGAPRVFSYIAGLGGRDITCETLEEIYFRTKSTALPDARSQWIGLKPAPRLTGVKE